jgi:hypothetical protein
MKSMFKVVRQGIGTHNWYKTEYINFSNVATIELLEFQPGNMSMMTICFTGGAVVRLDKVNAGDQELAYEIIKAWEDYKNDEK